MGLLNGQWTAFRSLVTGTGVLQDNTLLQVGTSQMSFWPAGGTSMKSIDLVVLTENSFKASGDGYEAAGKVVSNTGNTLVTGYIKKDALIDTFTGVGTPETGTPAIRTGSYRLTSVANRGRRVLTDKGELHIKDIKDSKWMVVMASANGAPLVWIVDENAGSITGPAGNNKDAEISLHPIRHAIPIGNPPVLCYSLAGHFTWKAGMPTDDAITPWGAGTPESDSFTAVYVGTAPVP